MKSLPQALCLFVIGLLLLGYVLGGKGFAHIGVEPIYIGEAALAVSLLLFLMAPNIKNVFWLPEAWIVLGLDFWCLLLTLPFVREYGVNTFRDAAIYGYSIFSFIIALHISNYKVIMTICRAYLRVLPLCIIIIPVLLWAQPDDPDMMTDELPLIYLKAGDVMVHLVGALSFALLGLRSAIVPVTSWAGNIVWRLFWVALVVSLMWTVAMSRGGLMAMICGLSVIAVYGVSSRKLIGFAVAVLTFLAVLAAFDVHFERDRRDISPWQVIENAVSIVSLGTGEDIDTSGDLEGTARWRLEWWTEIVGYTLFGDYFWMGKGFGINLADDDGFQVDIDEGSLRSPHNGHLTILARAGVIGLTLWVLFLGAFAVAQVRMAARMREMGLVVWQRLNLWVLSYWVTAVVNATFDVYLEGPQGGIWFWSITGFGLGLLAYQRRVLGAGPQTPEAVSAQRFC